MHANDLFALKQGLICEDTKVEPLLQKVLVYCQESFSNSSLLDVLSVRITSFWESAPKHHLEHDTSKVFTKSKRNKKNLQGCSSLGRTACCVSIQLKWKHWFSSFWDSSFPVCVFADKNKSNSSPCCVFSRLVPGATVVKGLNTLSAWALQNGLLAGKQVRAEWK